MSKAFKADAAKRLIPLMKKLRKIEEDIYALVIKSIGNAQMGAAYWNAQKVVLNNLYREMNLVFKDWATKEIPKRYKRSMSLIKKRIDASVFITNVGKKGLTELLRTNASTQIVRGLVDSSVESFLSSSIAGRQNLKNLFITTQQTLVNESMVNVAVATGFEMGDLGEAKTLLKSLFETPTWEAIEKKQFVQAGKYRYRPHYYAEMVARTKFHQAHSQAALMQSANHGTDLVEISTHNTTTRICMPFEGKIFSVKGGSLKFPPLIDSPPYHPNCLHLMYPTFESAMEVQGTLKEFSEFSLGKVARPPIPKSFIPIGAR